MATDLDGCREPSAVVVEGTGFSRHLLLRFSSPDCPVRLCGQQEALLLPISSTVFAAFGLLGGCHFDSLGRFAFGCGRHAARTYARAACSKPHSRARRLEGRSRVLSYVPSYSRSTFHTAVPTSAYPLAFPEALASSAILPQRALVGTYSLYRPTGESHSVVPPFHCSVLRSFRSPAIHRMHYGWE